MAQMTFQSDTSVDETLPVLKKLFGTASTGAAIRSALQLAVIISRCASPEKVMEVLNQHTGSWLRISVAR